MPGASTEPAWDEPTGKSAWRWISIFYWFSLLYRFLAGIPSALSTGFRWSVHYGGGLILFILFFVPNLLVFTACLLPAKFELTERCVPGWHKRFPVFWDYLVAYDAIWGMYESITRQGLQYFGVLCGILFATLHIEMLVHSLSNVQASCPYVWHNPADTGLGEGILPFR